MKTLSTLLLLATGLLAAALPLHADPSCQEAAIGLQKDWDKVTYLTAADQKKPAYETLVEKSGHATARKSDCTEVWTWDGIIRATYAGEAGGLTALKQVKLARKSFEKALKLDTKHNNGSAHTSLGSLYYQVPGWPIGFGNDQKAEELLKQGLAIAPQSIDANYFYGDYLFSQKRYAEARAALQKALAAEPRPGREVADEGRRKQIKDLMEKLDDKSR